MLLAMDGQDYAWMLDQAPSQRDGIRLVAGGVAPPGVLDMLRTVQSGLADEVAHPLAWMIVHDDEVIGMVNLVGRDPGGRFEIGYGMAPECRGRGAMTQAIGDLMPILAALGLREVAANTAIDNPASQRVLERNGFTCIGTKDDPEDGLLICWAKALA